MRLSLDRTLLNYSWSDKCQSHIYQIPGSQCGTDYQKFHFRHFQILWTVNGEHNNTTIKSMYTNSQEPSNLFTHKQTITISRVIESWGWGYGAGRRACKLLCSQFLLPCIEVSCRRHTLANLGGKEGKGEGGGEGEKEGVGRERERERAGEKEGGIG